MWICDVVGTVWEKSVPVTPFNTPESLRLLVIRKLDDPHIINLGRGNSRSADSGRLSLCFSRLEILGLRERRLGLSPAEGSPIVIVKSVTANPTLTPHSMSYSRTSCGWYFRFCYHKIWDYFSLSPRPFPKDKSRPGDYQRLGMRSGRVLFEANHEMTRGFISDTTFYAGVQYLQRAGRNSQPLRNQTWSH